MLNMSTILYVVEFVMQKIKGYFYAKFRRIQRV